MLPQEFLERMEQLLGEEYRAFTESYEQENCGLFSKFIQYIVIF